MIYFCATPIGNLEDITLRVLRILGEVDVIFSEDTRHTLKLLNHFNIKKPLKSCHEHNENMRAQQIIEMAQNGQNIAICSDAGMPAISDPGAIVLQQAAQNGVEFTVLPGACAAITALVLSAIDCKNFAFEGFVLREKAQRIKAFEELKTQKKTMIFYESPQRVAQTLKEMFEVFGERNAALCREITKIHEQCVRKPLSQLAEYFSENTRGECVIVVEGAKQSQVEFQTKELIEAIGELVASGIKTKTAAKLIASKSSQSANQLYNLYIEQQK